MTILESLREKKKNFYAFDDEEAKSKLVDLLNQYDLALENALLKLKNRGVEIADLKYQKKQLGKWLKEANKEIMQLRNK